MMVRSLLVAGLALTALTSPVAAPDASTTNRSRVFPSRNSVADSGRIGLHASPVLACSTPLRSRTVTSSASPLYFPGYRASVSAGCSTVGAVIGGS